jgi:hypothetical protein
MIAFNNFVDKYKLDRDLNIKTVNEFETIK